MTVKTRVCRTWLWQDSGVIVVWRAGDVHGEDQIPGQEDSAGVDEADVGISRHRRGFCRRLQAACIQGVIDLL